VKHRDALQEDPEREVRVGRHQSLVVFEVRVGRHQSLVVFEISPGRAPEQVPLVARYVRVDVDGLVVLEADIELKAVVRPRPELHVAALDVERKVGDVDTARGLVDGRRHPHDAAVTADHRHHLTLFLQTLVRTNIYTTRSAAYFQIRSQMVY